MFAVVCENFHVAFAPFRNRPDAERYSQMMTQYSQRNAVEQGHPDQYCTYRVVVMYIQVIDEQPQGVVEYDKNEASRKARLN
jgi:hypothetical protein